MRVTKRRVGPLALLALVGFFLLGSSWAIGLPVNGTYDENQHVVRAYAVVTGQWLPSGMGRDAANLPAETFRAPRSLLPANANCTWQHERGGHPLPASCQRQVTDSTVGPMPSTAARYNPGYYLLVGLPLRVWPDRSGVVVARLLSALLSAAMLAAAVAIALWSANRLLLAGVILVSTPLAMNLAGAVNPNGLEISAGVLLFAALPTLLCAPQRLPDAAVRWLTAAAVAAAVPLITVRQLGPVLFGCVVAASALVGRRDRLVEALRSRVVWLGLGVPVVVAVGYAGWWLLWSRVTNLTIEPGHGRPYGLGEILLRLPGERFRFYADQIVGRFSYGETTVSPLVVVGWYLLMAALLLPALWFGGLRLRLAVAGLFGFCLAVLVYGEIHFVPTFGWYSQSRYVMPVGVGMLLLAAFSPRCTAWLADRGWLGWPVVLLVAATVPLDLVALVRVMSRFQVGITASHSPFGGTWQPPLGSGAVLLAAVTGVLVLVAVAARSAATDTRIETFSPVAHATVSD